MNLLRRLVEGDVAAHEMGVVVTSPREARQSAFRRCRREIGTCEKIDQPPPGGNDVLLDAANQLVAKRLHHLGSAAKARRTLGGEGVEHRRGIFDPSPPGFDRRLDGGP